MRFSILAASAAFLAGASAVAAAPVDSAATLSTRDPVDARGLELDLGVKRREVDSRGLEMDLGVKRREVDSRGLELDLGVKRREVDSLASRGVDTGSGIAQRDGALTGPVTGLVEDAFNNLTAGLTSVLDPLGLGSVGEALSESDISVSAVNDEGVATVTVVGAGILDGVVLNVPVLASTGALAGPVTKSSA
ncbi:hypothetical protein JCM10207_008582 [Rhodosporidiobolus poonsookiae]